MSFIDKIKSLLGIKTNNNVEQTPVNTTTETTPVMENKVEETPVVSEDISAKVDSIVEQVSEDMENISTETNTEN